MTAAGNAVGPASGVSGNPVGYPLRVDAHGATARTDRAGYLRDLIEQVLFTAPGERVNRPDFGAGVGQLVFAPTGRRSRPPPRCWSTPHCSSGSAI